MKRRIVFVLFFCIGSVFIFANGNKENTVEDNFAVKVILPSGGPAVALSKMVYEKKQFAHSVTEYEVVAGPDILQARILSGEADIAIAATNFAAVVYAKNKSVTLLAPVVWGNLYCITSENITSVAELKGKTVYSFGRGVTPDLTVREILSKNGLNPDKDVTFQYVSSAADIPPAFLSGKAGIAIAAEPSLSAILAKKPDTKILIDIQKEWKENFDGVSYPQASLIVKTEFLKEHPEYVKAFIEAAEDSVVWVNANNETAAEYASKITPLPPVPVLTKAIPRLNIQFTGAQKAKASIERYFTVLAGSDPKFIGGKLPDEGFYYQTK